jgi:peptidoglycan L-alanyl-D-glutamate endopeptidase CwlK
MPKFGKTSKQRLAECHQDIQKVLLEAIKYTDFSVICGFRDKDAQDKAYAAGKSQVKWPNGKHNCYPSVAVDVAPYPIGWNDTSRFYYLAGVIMTIAKQMEVKLRWGGDWDGDGIFKDERFPDLGHFELV